MGKGYQFSRTDVVALRKLTTAFINGVHLVHHRNARRLTTTLHDGIYICIVDVCGPTSEKIDKMAKDLQTKGSWKNE